MVSCCCPCHAFYVYMFFSVSNFYEITYKRDFHLKIEHTGRIRWSFGGILTTSCDIDLTYYPFDEQMCDIELESWQYEQHKVQLYPFVDTPVDLGTLDDDPQWILENATVSSLAVNRLVRTSVVIHLNLPYENMLDSLKACFDEIFAIKRDLKCC